MKKKSQNSTLEKVSVAATVLLLIGVLVYFVSYTRSHTQIQTEEVYASNTPVSGSFARIESITTGWISHEGDETVYPSGTITLAPSKSQSGQLRVLFRENVGNTLDPSKIVGDSNTFTVTNGHFENGETSVTFTCTKGLPSMAEFRGYCSQEEYRWVIDVLEIKQDSQEFTQLAHAPIDAVILK